MAASLVACTCMFVQRILLLLNAVAASGGEDPYALLGVSRTPSAKEIKSARRREARGTYPLPAPTLLLLLALSAAPFSRAYAPPINVGLEVRVCQDKDCLLDGSEDALRLVRSMTPSEDGDGEAITVTACGCLGPCGSGPTVDVRRDGLRVKDAREGMDDYFLFRKVDSAEAVGDMLRIAGVEPVPSSKDAEDDNAVVTSKRKWHELDRNQRISLQRVLYALTALPLLNAHLNGTWDEIGGVAVPNSYYGIAAAIFVASQFMGTSQKSNAVE